jgi:hypothetical protein
MSKPTGNALLDRNVDFSTRNRAAVLETERLVRANCFTDTSKLSQIKQCNVKDGLIVLDVPSLLGFKNI